MKKELTYTSFCCGAGGLDMGLVAAGWRPIFAIDSYKNACQTYYNWSGFDPVHDNLRNFKVYKTDVNGEYEFRSFDTPMMLVGSFKYEGAELNYDDAHDNFYDNHQMWAIYHFLRQKMPDLFVLCCENNLKRSAARSTTSVLAKLFHELPYKVNVTSLMWEDWGVALRDDHVFLMGVRKDLNKELPKIDPPKRKVTPREVIGNFPEADRNDYPSIERLNKEMFAPSRQENRWDGALPGLRAWVSHIPLWPGSEKVEWKNGKPDICGKEKTVRPLTWQECAALNGFDDIEIFAGDRSSKYKQICAAVPVQLSKEFFRQFTTKFFKTVN